MQQQHISFDLFFTSLLPHRRRSQTTTSDMTCISITKSLFCFTRHSVVFPFSETRMSFGLRLFFFSFPCLSLFSCSALFDLRQEFRLSSLSFERRQKEASFSFDASISSFLLSTSLTPILLVAVFFTIRQHLHAEEVYPDKNKEYPRVDALTKFDHVFLVVSFSFSCCYFFIDSLELRALLFSHKVMPFIDLRLTSCFWHYPNPSFDHQIHARMPCVLRLQSVKWTGIQGLPTALVMIKCVTLKECPTVKARTSQEQETQSYPRRLFEEILQI